MMQEFVQAIEDTCKDMIYNEVHTAIPGKIISFSAKTCTATVQPVGKYKTSNGAKHPYPKITEAPVMFPYSEKSKSGIVFPIKKGDYCLIIVSEIELDEWKSGSVSDNDLRFDLTSGVVIPGLMSKGNDAIKMAIKKNSVIVAQNGSLASVGPNGLTEITEAEIEALK